jgi:LemA protein
VAESYPDLKASTSFVVMQRQLAETEDRVAAGGGPINGAVRTRNTRAKTSPAPVVAGVSRFSPAEYVAGQDPEIRSTPPVSC